MTANPLFSRLHQPGVGDYLAPGMPAAFDGVHPASAPAPALGQDTADVLTALPGTDDRRHRALDERENDRLKANGRQRMTKLAQTLGLTEFQTEIIATVRQFVDKEVIPNAPELERSDTYPQEIVDQMREMGLFGLMIPQEYGGLGESLLTYALCVEELARGWMSVSGRAQHPLHRGVHAAPARHRRAEAAIPAADGDRRIAAARFRCRSRNWAPTSPRSAPGRNGIPTAPTPSTARRCG